MRKVLLFSSLLATGLAGSQALPHLLADAPALGDAIRWVTMACLAFVMVHVGYEFEIDRSNLRGYGWDYVVAMTAAAFPWILVALYFVFVLLPSGVRGTPGAWQETLLAARFAAPTSAGVLFSMLAAAGLSATWLFRKARVLAIFDDLDTILLMIPLKALMIGMAWQLGAVLLVLAGLLAAAWRWLHRLRIPVSWPWVLGYAAGLVAVSEGLYAGSKLLDPAVPVHLEVLLPAFVLGCMIARPAGADPHSDDAREGHQEGPESAAEQRVATVVSAVFMLFVGLSMPAVAAEAPRPVGSVADAAGVVTEVEGGVTPAATITAAQPPLPWGTIAWHVVLVTLLANLGKMFPALCYRREASWRERLALAVGMWPRGEVGAGVLVVSLSYGIGGPVVTVAALSLALNLLLTGGFIWVVKRLVRGAPAAARA